MVHGQLRKKFPHPHSLTLGMPNGLPSSHFPNGVAEQLPPSFSSISGKQESFLNYSITYPASSRPMIRKILSNGKRANKTGSVNILNSLSPNAQDPFVKFLKAPTRIPPPPFATNPNTLGLPLRLKAQPSIFELSSLPPNIQAIRKFSD